MSSFQIGRGYMRGLFILLLNFTLVACSGFELDEFGDFGSLTGFSISSDKVFYSTVGSTEFKVGTQKVVYLNDSVLREGSIVIWDSELIDRVEFCEQVTSINTRRLKLSCPTGGELLLEALVIHPDGEEKIYSMGLTASTTYVGGPGPSPEPEPEELTGRVLYERNCLSCHSNNSKLGRPFDAIKGAIEMGTGGMDLESLKQLTDEEIQKISTAIQ